MMKPSIREKTRDDRREQILREAALIVGERGYHGFGIQELAQRCGLTKAGLLHHFPSKDQLLIALLRDRDRQDEAAVMALVELASQGTDELPPSLQTIRAAFHAIVERNAIQPELVRLYAMLRAEALNPAHPAHDFFAAREAATLDIFTQMVTPYSTQPRSTARQLLALMTGLELQWLREGQDCDMVAEWDRTLALLLP